MIYAAEDRLDVAEPPELTIALEQRTRACIKLGRSRGLGRLPPRQVRGMGRDGPVTPRRPLPVRSHPPKVRASRPGHDER